MENSKKKNYLLDERNANDKVPVPLFDRGKTSDEKSCLQTRKKKKKKHARLAF